MFRRGFVQGDRDTFSLTGTAVFADGGVCTLKGEQIQFFKKVEKGEAELTILTSLKVIGPSGAILLEETNRLSKARYNAYGIIITPEKTKGNEMAIANILQYGMLLPYKGLKGLGPQKFDYRQAENTEYYIRGTFEKQNESPDQVTILTKVDFFNNQTPVQVNMDSKTEWNLKTHRAEEIKVTAKGLPQNPGSQKIASLTIIAKRIESPSKS